MKVYSAKTNNIMYYNMYFKIFLYSDFCIAVSQLFL